MRRIIKHYKKCSQDHKPPPIKKKSKECECKEKIKSFGKNEWQKVKKWNVKREVNIFLKYGESK